MERFDEYGFLDHRETLYHPLGVNGALSASQVYEYVPFPSSSNSTFYSYDVLGRVTEMFNSLGDGLRVGYDANDRLASLRSYWSPTVDLLQNLYPSNQAADRPTAAQMPLYGCQANFTYHGADHDFRLMQRDVVNPTTSAVLSLFNVQFDARDRIHYETNNATQRTYTYDANGRAMWIDDNTAGNWLNRDFYYDSAGNSTGRADFGPSGTTFWETMSFDAVDRFITRTRSIAAAASVVHDPRGRVINDGDYSYEWNRDDRMTRVTRLSDSAQWSFRYDGTGRLLRFQEGGQWHRLQWGDGQLRAEYVGALNAETTLVRMYHADGYTQSGSRYLYGRDVRGSVRTLLGAGKVKRAWTYEPWGQRVDAGGADPTLESRLGFAGYVYHPETGLYFTPARVYRPELRRWLSRDPLGERATADGNNVYAYVAGDPVNQIDPTGEYGVAVVAVAAFGAAWAVSHWYHSSGYGGNVPAGPYQETSDQIDRRLQEYHDDVSAAVQQIDGERGDPVRMSLERANSLEMVGADHYLQSRAFFGGSAKLTA